MKKTQALAITHFIFLLLLIFWNYYANTGIIHNKTIADVSDKYNNLFTPASYAFSIWGIIYLGLIGQGIYMLYCAFSKTEDDGFILKSTPWLILANIGNAAWVWFWLNEATGSSVLVMISILVFLLVAVVKLDMERWDAPVKTMAGVWWPIDLYVGWIAVATVANISAHLAGIGWTGGFSEVGWTVTIICVVTLINLLMIILRNMREFAAVGIWALIAIAVQHWNAIPEIQWAAITAATILFVATTIHAYKNRATSPFVKLRQ